jgi:hypothetical protein
MDNGVMGGSRSAQQALDAIYATLLSSNVTSQISNPVMSELLRQLDLVTQARRSRLIAAEDSVPNVIWLVLFGGAVVTIGFTFFFGTRNLRAQTTMTGMLALLIFSDHLIIIAIDRPFTGSVKVESTPLAIVLADFQADSGRR